MGNSNAKNKQKVTPRDRAILELKIQADRLKQYQKKIRLVLDRETEVAKIFLKQGNKSMALLALKKKKYQEKLLDGTSQQLFNLEEMTNTIEFTQVQHQVIEGLKKGNEILDLLQKEVSLDDVERLMADTAEAIDYQNVPKMQISEMLAGNINSIDEGEIEDELEQLIELALPQVAKKDEPLTLPTVNQSSEINVDSETVEKEEEEEDDGNLMMAA